MACDAMVAASDTPVMMATTDLNCRPRTWQRRKRQGDGGDGQDDADGAAGLDRERVVGMGNHRYSRAPANEQSICHYRADGQGLKGGPDGREDEQRPSNRPTTSAATARAATRIRA